MPFIERTQEAIAYYKEAETHDAGTPLARVETMGFEKVAYAYREDTPVLSGISFEVSRVRSSGSSAPPEPASRRSSSCCCACADPTKVAT